MGWEICWVTCFYLYSPNIRIQKDKFSQQCFQEICWTLVCVCIYIYMQSWKQCALSVITTMALWQLTHLHLASVRFEHYIYIVIHNKLKVLVLLISFPIIIYDNGAPLPCLFEKFSIYYHIARQHAPLLHNKTLISLFCTMHILFIFVIWHPG